MKTKLIKEKSDCKRGLILALHSCSTTLGVAIIDSQAPENSLSTNTFPVGRSLSNNIVNCVEEILPASSWNQLDRISVAIGPGGFTGTRLSVVMARTLAQQLDCPLDGISSFALMAPRLSRSLHIKNRNEPFWITQELPRTGILAGKYQIKSNSKIANFEIALELQKPQLLNPGLKVEPAIKASDNVAIDVVQLLQISLLGKKIGQHANWQKVLPIYPTSPIKNIHKNSPIQT